MTHIRRALAGALLTAPVALTLAACGSGTAADVTGSPAVGVEEGGSVASPTGTVDPSISAVIGSWAAQYGVARNTVLTALGDLGAAAKGGGDVSAAAKAVLTAVTSAEGVPPCPDPATEGAYRQALSTLEADATAVQGSGDGAAASALAEKAESVFAQTESALTVAYG